MRIKARITTPAVIEINRMPMILRFKFTNGRYKNYAGNKTGSRGVFMRLLFLISFLCLRCWAGSLL